VASVNKQEKKKPEVAPLPVCSVDQLTNIACKLRRARTIAEASLPMIARVSQAAEKVKFKLGTAIPVLKSLQCRVEQPQDIGLAQCR
jgi:hypothetical protein